MDKRPPRNRVNKGSPKAGTIRVSEDSSDEEQTSKNTTSSPKKTQQPKNNNDNNSPNKNVKTASPSQNQSENKNNSTKNTTTSKKGDGKISKPCQVYKAMGSCPYGEYCQYKHGDDDKRDAAKERPEDYNAPPIELVKAIPKEYSAVIVKLVEDVKKAKQEAADDKSDEKGTVTGIPRNLRNVDISYEGDKVKLSGKSLRNVQSAWNLVWDRVVSPNVDASKRSFVILPRNEPFRFVRIRLPIVSRRGRRLEFKGYRVKTTQIATNPKPDVSAGHIVIGGSSTGSETIVEGLLSKSEKDSVVILRTGLTLFKLQHDNYDEVVKTAEAESSKEESTTANEEDDSNDEEGKGQGGKQNRRRRSLKQWSAKDISGWEVNKDFRVNFEPYWNLPLPDKFRDVLKEREFTSTLDNVIEIKALVDGEWKLFYYRWVPQDSTESELDVKDTESERDEEGDDEDDGGDDKGTKSSTVKAPPKGHWEEALDVVDGVATVNDGTLIYSLNSSSASRDDKDVLVQVVKGDKAGKSKVLLDLLNSKPEFSPFTLNNDLVRESSVPIGEYYVLRRQRWTCPENNYVIYFTNVIRGTGSSLRAKGTTVSFVFAKNSKANEVITAIRRFRDWLQIIKAVEARDQKKKNANDNNANNNTNNNNNNNANNRNNRGGSNQNQNQGRRAGGQNEELPDLRNMSSKELRELWLKSKSQANQILVFLNKSTQK